ncbi:hypothetical protein J4050_05045 [Winogradskyella sp. DF17]|uniref:Uncharacterized protein n=1 Tax=Winogradskyella pelagia TaxID=2819984 RepID=A0ABS3T030_9FLAO|nr:hypothetical protein [Winogradskyella sp. DF17]MBO3116101.1 hypothetical protein [Winogradskyella sp. DF17]
MKVTEKLISHIEGINMISDVNNLSKDVYSTINEERFTPNNSTYNELASSGNLSLIENDSIKQLLLDLEELYKNNLFGIEHEAFEYKEYINKSLFTYVDLNSLKSIFYNGKTAESLSINKDHFNALFNSLEYKNGLAISNIISEEFIPRYKDIKKKSSLLIDIINNDLEIYND